MTSELAGKVALVTGGASGIGRASVVALSSAGAAVAVAAARRDSSSCRGGRHPRGSQHDHGRTRRWRAAGAHADGTRPKCERRAHRGFRSGTRHLE